MTAAAVALCGGSPAARQPAFGAGGLSQPGRQEAGRQAVEGSDGPWQPGGRRKAQPGGLQ